jgi:hypothetical protein
MNIEALKLELIQWILLLQDIQLLNEIQTIKENSGKIQPLFNLVNSVAVKAFLLMWQMILMQRLRGLKNICCHELSN